MISLLLVIQRARHHRKARLRGEVPLLGLDSARGEDRCRRRVQTGTGDREGRDDGRGQGHWGGFAENDERHGPEDHGHAHDEEHPVPRRQLQRDVLRPQGQGEDS